MNRSHRIAISLLGAAVAIAALPAQAGEEPTVEELIAKTKTALGGAAAIDKVHSMAVEAICSGPGGRFTTQVHSVRGGGSYFRQVADDRRMEVWTTADSTWTVDENGARKSVPPPLRSFVRGHEFHLLALELEDRFSNFRSAGSETFGGRPSHKIAMTDGDDLPAALWVDRESHLPLAIETNPAGAAGAVRVIFEDWDTLEDVKLFRAFTLMEGAEREFRYEYVSIVLNPPANGSFHAPAASVAAAQASAAADRKAIDAILQADRDAHLKSDASLLAAHLADRLIEVSDGEIRTQTKAEIQEFFEGSFRGAKFHTWEDTAPPVVRFSADSTMAWVIRRVRADREDFPDGKSVRMGYTSAYTATYEKQAQGWRMTSVTSTFMPRAAES